MAIKPNIELKTLSYQAGDVGHVTLEGDVITAEGTNTEIKSDHLSISANTYFSETVVISERVGQSNDLEIKGGELLVGGPAHGRIKVRDQNGKTRVECEAQTGAIKIRQSTGTPITSIYASGEMNLGMAPSTYGRVQLQDQGQERIALNALDGGSLAISDAQDRHIFLENGCVKLGRQGLEGKLIVYSDQGSNDPVVELNQQGMEINHDSGMRTRIGADGVTVGGTALDGKLKVAYPEGRPFAEIDAQQKTVTVTPEQAGSDPTFILKEDGHLDLGSTDFPGRLGMKDRRNRDRVIVDAETPSAITLLNERGTPVFQAKTEGLLLGSRTQENHIELNGEMGQIHINDRNNRHTVSLNDAGELTLSDSAAGHLISAAPMRGVIHEHHGRAIVISAEHADSWPAWPGASPSQTVELLTEVKRLKSIVLAIEEKVQLHEQVLQSLQTP